MSDVLVLYVDPFGPTAQVAMQVAEQLCRRGLRVELRRVGRAATTTGCDTVVLGGATGPRSWDPSALDHLRETDGRVDLHLFHTGFAGATGEPASVPDEVLALARARGIGQVPVLPDVDGADPVLRLPASAMVRRPLSPALHWADVLADRLRANRDRLALVG